MPDLFSTGASLLEGAARTDAQSQELEVQKQNQTLQTLQNVVGHLAEGIRQKGADEAAMARQKLIGQQNIEAEKLRQQGGLLVLSKPIVEGLAKSTGDESWTQMEGKEMPAAQVLALYRYGMERRTSDSEITEVGVGKNQKQKVLYNKKTNTQIPIGQPYDIRGEKTGANEQQKELTRLDRAIQNDKAAIDKLLGSKKGLPEENKLLQMVTLGHAGSLSKAEQAQIATFKVSVNRLRQNLEREQKLVKDSGEPTVDRADVLASLAAVEDVLPKESTGNPDDVIEVQVPGESNPTRIKRKDLDTAKQRIPGLKVLTK